MQLYQNKSCYPKPNAQDNLQGRTHYVDDDTLRAFRSKIISTHIVYDGLFFALVESLSLDYNHTKRGFRYVIFDIFGTVIDRPKLEEAWRTSEKAEKAMWAQIDKIDPKAHTLDAIARHERHFATEMAELRNTVTSESRVLKHLS
jgi:hypothetical protein